MQEEKGREFNRDRKEFHLCFGQEGGLGRRYNIYSGERYDNPYIYENDQEMADRYDRWETIEWEEKMKKKYRQVGKDNGDK
jgi:hypothetical protein